FDAIKRLMMRVHPEQTQPVLSVLPDMKRCALGAAIDKLLKSWHDVVAQRVLARERGAKPECGRPEFIAAVTQPRDVAGRHQGRQQTQDGALVEARRQRKLRQCRGTVASFDRTDNGERPLDSGNTLASRRHVWHCSCCGAFHAAPVLVWRRDAITRDTTGQ